MSKEKNSLKQKSGVFFFKTILMLGVLITFYKIPTFFAEKISYYKLQKKIFK